MSERHALPGEVQSLGACVDRAGSADLGRDGGPGSGAGRHHGSRARHGNRVLHDSARPPGAARGRPAAPPGGSGGPVAGASRRGEGPDRGRGPGAAGRAGRAGTPSRRCAGRARACGSWRRRSGMGHAVSHQWWPSRCRGGLQPASQSQDARGAEPSRPRRPVRYINQQVRRFSGGGSRSSRSTPRRRNWSATSRTRARWRPKGQPEEVRVHDFVIPERGRAMPYGVYDMAATRAGSAWASTTTRPRFAVQTIRRWWRKMGRPRYPRARVVAHHRRWRRQQRLARAPVEMGIATAGRRTRLAITVCHLPPGTSKWNKIEHRLFSFITRTGAASRSSARGDRQPDRRHPHHGRAERAVRPGSRDLSEGQVIRRPDGGPQPRARPLPRRLELHHSPAAWTEVIRSLIS